MAKWSHSLEWITPVPVSVSQIVHKNSPPAIYLTSLYFVFVICVASSSRILYLYDRHFQFPNFYFVNRQPFSPHFSLLCSALQTSPLYFGANLVIRAQPCDYILLHIVHMSVHGESILHCCTSSVKYPFHIVHQM